MPFGLRLVAIVALLSLPTGEARANKQKARELYRKGMAEYVLEHWDAAILEFEAGFREEQEPAFLFNIAQAHRKARRHEQSIQYFRKYLDFAPEATDRAQVEKDIAEEERAVAEANKAPPPPVASGMPDGGAGTLATSERTPPPDMVSRGILPEVKASPIEGGALSPEPAPQPQPQKRRWPIWVAAGGAALVLVGGTIALAVAYTTPNDAAIPSSSLGSVNFP